MQVQFGKLADQQQQKVIARATGEEVNPRLAFAQVAYTQKDGSLDVERTQYQDHQDIITLSNALSELGSSTEDRSVFFLVEYPSASYAANIKAKLDRFDTGQFINALISNGNEAKKSFLNKGAVMAGALYGLLFSQGPEMIAASEENQLRENQLIMKFTVPADQG